MANPNNPQNNELNIPKKITRTYSSDLTKSVQEKGGEAYRIARVEQQIKEKEAKIEAHQNKSNLTFGLGGLMFILLAILAFVYFNSKSNVTLNPEPATTTRSIIFYDTQNNIDVTGLDQDKIESTFNKITTESKLNINDISNITFIENGQGINLARLLKLLEVNLPTGMLPYLERNYFFGLFADTGLSENQSGKNWPFIIIRTNSYADISPAVIDWEVHLLDDLAGLLGINIGGENNYLLQNKFANTIVSNKETRALKNKNGEVVLMYLFLDEQNILITRNKNTLDEVLLRLYSPKK